MNSLLPLAPPDLGGFLTTTAQAVGVIMLADFVHWLQDAYGSEHTPLFGARIIRANIVHHHHPRYFTRLTWWQSSRDLVLLSAGLLGFGWWLGFLDWRLALFALVSANANQVHKWSHRTRRENGWAISLLQDARVLQTPRHHALHHSDPKNTFYCPITNLVNPLLEPIRFWPAIEWAIWRLTGIRHRHDTSNRGAGPAPEWLEAYRLPATTQAPLDGCRPEKTATCASCKRAPSVRALVCPHQPHLFHAPAASPWLVSSHRGFTLS